MRELHPLKIAIVEDNATARTNLRSHLLSLQNFDIASYSNGKELRNGLRVTDFDAIFIDYHLGQNKNGVEWIQSLRDTKLLKPSTGLIFITSDSMPNTIGQILDMYPDLIIIKPYTIRNLLSSFKHYMKVRQQTKPVLEYINKASFELALDYIDEKLDNGIEARFRSDFIKLKGRILLQAQQYEKAADLYSKVLNKSQNVMWAHWGLIKSEFFIGKWNHCQDMLDRLIEQSLTKDKAYEWLASVELGKKNYEKAEALLDKIKESELSIQATRLKTMCYKMQGKADAAIKLLERKIQGNLSIRERMVDYTMELARYHLHLADQVLKRHQKQDEVNEAKKLIGRASRNILDRHAEMQKDYMLALAHLLEDDSQKAHKIMLANEQLYRVEDANIVTKVDAVKVWFGLGEKGKANELLESCDEVLMSQINHIDSIVSNELITSTEQSLGIEKNRAMSVNEQGMSYFQKNQQSKALQCFHRAYTMFPGVPAFALNLLQSLYECGQYEYKGVTADIIINELQNLALNDKNQHRFNMLADALSHQAKAQ
ncbi:response regulator [Agaribacter flavus]|uniref:Response regulator n=1 Tax=Agaribacter flavus TaxID=1902781 RepID=A0ABV7FIJ9_9ALTE